MYTLFYYPCNASLAPHFVLKALNIPYQLELVDRKKLAQKSAQYLSLNPTGRIPTLVDDDFVLFESAAICLYLAEKHPEASLIPLDLKQKATFNQWLMYLTSTLQTELMTYFYPERHTQNALIYDDIVRTQQARLKDILQIIDTQLSENTFLVGDSITVCDYILFMLCIWADEIQHPPLSFNNLNRYLKNMARNEAVQQACKIEEISLAAYAI